MDEEECNYNTPVGKIIKRLNELCKKPQIDDELSKALKLFKEKLNEEEQFLVNGIFRINFAEAALFIQSSSELYGKKVDLLWDQLLEFHTRLIQYDCEHAQEKGKKLNQEVINQLEERRNRYKRKKKFKLLLPQNDNIEQFLFEKIPEEQSDPDENTTDQFERDEDIYYTWKGLEFEAAERRKIPNAIYKQQSKMYRLRNYTILKCQDFDILDPEDEEFNTKYSRVPGWHHIYHLFEYNDKGLLPDKNNLISILRLTAYGKAQFLRDRNISPKTPFSEYKEEYISYRNKFFEEESKKWQNMPLDTLEDLHKQLLYLAQKERESEASFNNNNANQRNTKESNNKLNEIIQVSDDESLFELSFSCNNDFTTSNLFVRLEKLSSEIINTKLRQDSGFFEFTSDNDDNDCDENNDASVVANVTNNTDQNIGLVNEFTSNADNGSCIDNNSDNIVTTNVDNVNNTDQNVVSNTGLDNELTSNTDNNGENIVSMVTGVNLGEVENTNNIDNSNILEDCHNNSSNAVDDLNDFETRSFISDHDYCSTPPQDEMFNKEAASNSAINTTKNGKNNSGPTKEIQSISPFCGTSRVIPDIKKLKSTIVNKMRKNGKENSVSPPKRRKLSQKQIEKLVKSIISPVKEMKFEKFFSKNYQPQLGEGEIQEVDYESCESDIENGDEVQIEHNDPVPSSTENNHSNHSEQYNDDNQSICSDHNYCQPPVECSQDDFLDAPVTQNIAESNPTNNISPDVESEYSRLLKSLIESSDENTRTLYPIERTAHEKERREARVRVEQWRETITPILKNLKETDFNIHEYGSHIMEGMSVNDSKPFSDIVKNKSSAEVVRYFISSLQLANTSNIEICGAKKGELSNDTYSIKLLTKDRYHEHLSEYNAPSEQTLRERLEKMKQWKAEKLNDGEPSAKQVKLTEPAANEVNMEVTPSTSTDQTHVHRNSQNNISHRRSKRRDTTEELFRERLVTVQERNSNVQIHSTPRRRSKEAEYI